MHIVKIKESHILDPEHNCEMKYIGKMQQGGGGRVNLPDDCTKQKFTGFHRDGSSIYTNFTNMINIMT